MSQPFGKQASADDEAFLAAHEQSGKQAGTDDAAFLDSEGEAGHAGHDPYAPGETEKRRLAANTERTGNTGDALKSWANSAALGTGPQIAGVMGAVANAATDPMHPEKDVDAYRDVRDSTAKDLALSANTTAGKIGAGVGAMSTPGLPAVARGATIPERAYQGAKVGGIVGAVSGAANSRGDLTKLDSENLKKTLVDALAGGVGGALGGGTAGAALGTTAVPARSIAETQALRAAGLRGGIKNSIQKDLGVSSMPEARELGRKFLDEELIPPVGSSEAVAKRAEGLQGRAGNAIGSTLTRAELSGAKADEAAVADAVRKALDSQSAVATDLSGAKGYALADALERQGAKTPGSFIGINRAKSDAWKSANFAADAPMAAQLYRKGVGAARDDIERQVGDALGPDAAAELAGANKKYGVASDALKLAENASTRDAAKQGFTTSDALALLSGGTAGGFAGHPTAGAGAGLGLVLGKKAFDKYGHASAARLADFIADRSGGGVGGQTGAALAPYLELLDEEKK